MELQDVKEAWDMMKRICPPHEYESRKATLLFKLTEFIIMNEEAKKEKQDFLKTVYHVPHGWKINTDIEWTTEGAIKHISFEEAV